MKIDWTRTIEWALPLIAIQLCLLASAEARYITINMNMAMSISEDPHHLSADMIRICELNTGISKEELRKLSQNDLVNSTESTQCFVHCIYEQIGLMRDGVFSKRDNVENLAVLTDSNTHGRRQCHDLRGTNKCETAFLIYQCHYEKHYGMGLGPAADTTTASHAMTTESLLQESK